MKERKQARGRRSKMEVSKRTWQKEEDVRIKMKR